MLTHLLDNAVRYSPDGGTVTVAARPRGEAVEISVADEGVGIPLAEQERIFRKFYRGEGGARAGTGGTGLGLFIVRGLVTAMGGRIWVSSAEGRARGSRSSCGDGSVPGVVRAARRIAPRRARAVPGMSPEE